MNEVWAGTKQKTKGGLTKENLILNKKGVVVSLLKHNRGVERMSGLTKKPANVEPSVPKVVKEKKPRAPKVKPAEVIPEPVKANSIQ